MKGKMSKNAIDSAYRLAYEAKVAYVAAVAELQKTAEKYGPEICLEYTETLRAERPDLVERLKAAYAGGQPIADDMMSGGRWPKNSLSKYSDTLEAVPERQRSPELIECLGYWKAFAAADDEINIAYPPPEHFRWNGAQLTGPNLWPDFGVVSK